MHADQTPCDIPQTPAAGSRAQQALQRMQGLSGAAVVGLLAFAAAAPSQAVVVPTDPTLVLGGSLSANHNSSGFFTSDAHTGSASGESFGATLEGVKLYGSAGLLASAHMFYGGQMSGSSTSTGVAMAWWGPALNVQTTQRDPETGEVLREGDTFVFHYEFSLSGQAGTNWSLKGGFLDYLPDLQNNSSLLQASYVAGAQQQGSLSEDGSFEITGALASDPLDWESGSGYFWVVTLSADLPFDPSRDLLLTVPQNSIDAGVNAAPVPEASQWAMLMAGLGAVLTVVRRQRRAGAAAQP